MASKEPNNRKDSTEKQPPDAQQETHTIQPDKGNTHNVDTATTAINDGQQDEKHQTIDEHEAESKLIQFDIAELLSIKCDVEKHLVLQFRKQSFVLYSIDVSINTKRKTTWTLYLKYSEIEAFHHKLKHYYKRTCKFNSAVKSTLSLPKLPPNKTKKLDTAFIEQQIKLFNNYMTELTKYVSYSTRKTQHLYMHLFQIDSLYKYVANEDIQMLTALQNYDHHTLAITDANNSNILHYAVSAPSTQCIECVQDNKALITTLLHSKDQFNWTPLQLAKHFNNEQILNALKPYDDTHEDEKQSATEKYVAVQYVQNVCKKTYKQRFWIIINPQSGSGDSIVLWNEVIKPFFDLRTQCIEYEVLITTKQYHARNACQSLAADHPFAGIVVLGGDGTVSEVLNGCYHNANIQNKSLCFIPIPCGSGNALSIELGMHDVVDALRKISTGFVTTVDAFIASQVDEADVYSFVSTQWGVLSAIDLESENMRWMGDFRFTVKSVLEIMQSTSYKARIYFKPVNANVLKECMDGKDRTVGVNEEDDWWKQLEKIDLTAKKIEKNSVCKYPSDWVCVEGEFQIICVTNVQWMADGFKMGGQDFDCKSNALRLFYTKKTKRWNQTKFLLSMESGKHVDLDFVRYYNVNEVVIEPLGKGPPMDVDGETKPLKPLYAKSLPSDFVVPCA